MTANDDYAVREAFARWVSWQAGAPSDPESLVEHVEVSHDYVGLLDTGIEGRRLIWKSVPSSARRVTAPTVSIESVDPWAIEAAPLRHRSDHVAICAGCGGEKTVACALCAGDGKVLCYGCNGHRKTYGYAANGSYRLMNCKVCRGKGEVDCGGCRRGIAVCASCAGEGRLQRWIEIESWQRAVSTVHPPAVAIQFAWEENPANEIVERDAQLLVDATKARALISSDVGDIPPEWLDTLAPKLMQGERVARQRLRIARVPTHRVHYRLGSTEDQMPFSGLRLIGPASAEGSAFGHRVRRLRSLRCLLLAIALVITIASLARDAFFWSIWTFLSLLGCIAALIAIYVAAADWTAGRRSTRQGLITAASCLIVAIAFAIAALPRISHAQRLIAAGKLEDAQSELRALHNKATATTWADLRVAQVRHATEIGAAQIALDQIPPKLPQRAIATDAVDQLILRTARDNARLQNWSEASAALALLHQGARGRPDSIATASAVLLPAARLRIDSSDWTGAASEILTARQIGVPIAALSPLDGAIRKAAINTAAEAKAESDARQRLRLRLAAEGTYMSWERATDTWGTPDLIALRTAMARDVAAVEHSERRRRLAP